MARDEDLSLVVLQGVGPSPVSLYPPSVLGRWSPLHTLDEDLRIIKSDLLALFAASL